MPDNNRKTPEEESGEAYQLKKKRDLLAQEQSQKQDMINQEPRFGEWTAYPDGRLVYAFKHPDKKFHLQMNQEQGTLQLDGDYHDSGLELAFKDFAMRNGLQEGQDYSISKTKNSLTITIKGEDNFYKFIGDLQKGNANLSPELQAAFNSYPMPKPSPASKPLDQDEPRPKPKSPFTDPFDINLTKK